MVDELSANKARFVFKVDKTELSVVSFTAEERIFSTYTVNLELVSKDDLSLDDLIGQKGCLTIHGLQGTRYFHGLVNKLMMTGTKGEFRLYRATLVPAVWALDLASDCRIFQEQNTPKIVEKVLQGAGISADQYDFRLRGNYAAREYCVQFQETNLAFITRLLEKEGIFYFFEHTQDKHLVVFGDDVLNYQPIDGEMEVLFNQSKGMVSDEEYIYNFEFSRKIHTGKLSLRDYLFEKPGLDLAADSQDKKHTNLERYEYPGHYTDPSAGKGRAKVYLESALVERDQALGKSNCPRLMPGKTFQLKTDSLREEMKRKYLLLSVVHMGKQPQVLEQYAEPGEGYRYENRFLAIPDSVIFRPARETSKPRIYGVQSAVVVGPAGEEIYTDKHGRVKVQFHWDRLGKRDDKSSCWIRVTQAWAGAGWGALYIPRIGQEVIVSFLDGDPDRPIIIGRVYHGNNMPPYSLPVDKTKTSIKSNSSPGGGGSNELRFEDKKGSEEIYLHSQKDWNTVVENDRTTQIGSNQSTTVGGGNTTSIGNDDKISIGNNETIAIGSNKTVQVGSNHTESIGANMTITVGANESETVSGNKTETINVVKALTVGAAYQVTVGAAMNETVGAAKAEEIGGAKSVNIGGFSNQNVALYKATTVGQNCSNSVGEKYSLKAKTIEIEAEEEMSVKVGQASLVMKKDGTVTIKGKDFVIEGSGKGDVTATGALTLKGGKIDLNP